jgi:hypothetical protein
MKQPKKSLVLVSVEPSRLATVGVDSTLLTELLPT